MSQVGLLARRSQMTVIEGWVIDMRRRGLAEGTIYIFTWAVAHEHLTRNPVARLQRPKLRRLVPDPTPEHEVMRAMSVGTPLIRWDVCSGN